MKEILVSVCCQTYNHEKYIATAIESFLMQRADFGYEIIINDDASTDLTASILKEYERKYPGLITVVYQKENQYSKGNKKVLLDCFGKARGKYIAECEGDDYWTDPEKLQKQVNFMESHPDCSLCIHDAFLVNEDRSGLGLFPGRYARTAGSKNINELIFIPAASMLFRKKNVEALPGWYIDAKHGDFALVLVSSNYGDIYYMNECMSAYRTNVPGSAMYEEKKIFAQNPDVLISHIRSRISELENFNRWSGYKHDALVRDMILHEEFTKYSLERNIRELRKARFRSILETMGAYEILKMYVRCIAPKSIYNKLHEIKKRFS